MEQQKKVLEMELQQWRQSAFPQQNPTLSLQAPAVSVNAECSLQGQTMPSPANPASLALEAEVKQLQAKLKVSGWVNELPYALS